MGDSVWQQLYLVTDCTVVAKRMVAAPAKENALELQGWPLQCTGD